jgi:hypothetical protein
LPIKENSSPDKDHKCGNAVSVGNLNDLNQNEQIDFLPTTNADLLCPIKKILTKRLLEKERNR